MKISRLFWIGLIFVLSGVVFVGGLLYLQDISIKKSNYTFTVLFENVQGLHVGDQVDMLGKKIGKVTKTHFMGQKIAVELAIDNGLKVKPIDTSNFMCIEIDFIDDLILANKALDNESN